MTQPMQMADFFAMEAGEYLERLDGLVSQPDQPDGAELRGLARALRGSALMAGQQQVARVAGGLEAVARGFRDGSLAWDEALRQLAIRAVDDLKVLVRAIAHWGTSEDARAHSIATELEKVAGPAPSTARKGTQELDPGTRAFIAREGAAVGNALDLAARTLSRNPTAVDALDAVMRALQPLRGIASLSDLPPLPDLLDGIERAVEDLMQRSAPPPNAGNVFDAAAKAVSRASQEITATGEAAPDPPEAEAFARHLGILLDMDTDIIPIETLYHQDAGPHIVTQGTPEAGEAPGRLEMVSLAERLNQAAEDLSDAQSHTQRQLRAYALAPTLRALASAGGEAMKFANAARDAIARGAAASQTVGLAEHLRQAGSILAKWEEGGAADQDQASAQHLSSVTASLGALVGVPQAPQPRVAAPVATLTPPVVTATPPATPPVAPIVQPSGPVSRPTAPLTQPSAPATPAAPVAPVVPPIPTPTPTPTPAAAVPTAPVVTPSAPPTQPPALETGLAASMETYYQLTGGGGAGAVQAQLDELFGGPPGAPSAAPEALQAAGPVSGVGQAGAAPPSAPAPESEQLEPITNYCYSGPAALQRARELKAQLRSSGNDGGSDLLEEIFDLVELGLQPPA